MVLKIKRVICSNREEVLARKFNIYLGVSLGNRWFRSRENLREAIVWGLKNTKERFGIEIADGLQAVNFQYRDNYTRQGAIRKALKEGDLLVNLFEEIISELPPEDSQRIDILRWSDLADSLEYRKKVDVCVDFFEKNIRFRQRVRDIVKEFLISFPRNWTDDRIDKVCLYVLNEIPECFEGFRYGGIHYNCWIYPGDGGSLMNFVSDIQEKGLFQEILDFMNYRKNVFVGVEV